VSGPGEEEVRPSGTNLVCVRVRVMGEEAVARRQWRVGGKERGLNGGARAVREERGC
jgi:hypothetical protein